MAARPPSPTDIFSSFYKTEEELDHKSPDSPATPPESPRFIDPSFRTPERLKAAVQSIQEDSLVFFSPDRDGKRTVEQGMEALHLLSTPDRKRKASDVMGTVLKQLVPDLEQDEDLTTPDFHQAASKRLQEEGLSDTCRGIIRSTVEAMGKSPQRIVSVDHITRLGKTGGCHLDLPGSGIKVETLAINPKTRIKFVLLDDRKLSTFFPPEIRLSEVIALANGSAKIAQQNNRSLRMTPYGFPIEVYTRDNILITSVFPVFFFDHYADSQKYLLTASVEISSEEILKAAFDLGAKISYSIKNVQDNRIEAIVLDLAPHFEKRTNVNKGILFRFDRNTIPELIDHYAQFTE